jgi:phospholipid transport system substrate-binding protein
MVGIKHDVFTAGLKAALMALILAAGLAAAPARAANPAEMFIAQNVQRGLVILNNKQLGKEERRSQFQAFLLGLTDIRVIADYTLGQYRRGASPADMAAFEDAFKDYALAVYQTYFDKFSGQTLQVTGSYPLDPDETVVKTVMIDPAKPNDPNPLLVNFRVANEGGRPAVVDFSVSGVWLRETERSDFTSYLGQNSGNIPALIAALKTKTEQERASAR